MKDRVPRTVIRIKPLSSLSSDAMSTAPVVCRLHIEATELLVLQPLELTASKRDKIR